MFLPAQRQESCKKEAQDHLIRQKCLCNAHPMSAGSYYFYSKNPILSQHLSTTAATGLPWRAATRLYICARTQKSPSQRPLSFAPGSMATSRALPSGLPQLSWMSTSGLEGNRLPPTKTGAALSHPKGGLATAGIPPATAGHGKIRTPTDKYKNENLCAGAFRLSG